MGGAYVGKALILSTLLVVTFMASGPLVGQVDYSTATLKGAIFDPRGLFAGIVREKRHPIYGQGPRDAERHAGRVALGAALARGTQHRHWPKFRFSGQAAYQVVLSQPRSWTQTTRIPDIKPCCRKSPFNPHVFRSSDDLGCRCQDLCGSMLRLSSALLSPGAPAAA